LSGTETITMFSTWWCGACKRLKALMQADGIPFEVVDIENDPEAERFVIEVNRGNATVPTVLFPDGTTLTNPSLAQVKARVASG
jgi:mycoredoxin